MDIRHSTSDIRHAAGRAAVTFPLSRGFTLVELLAVIVLISILLMATGLSVRKALLLAKNTKAESECRELVNALLSYRSTYGEWPGNHPQGEVEATESVLKPLISAADNARGLVFLNLTLADSAWNDPWGKPSRIAFPDGSPEVTRPTALETCVSFPFRRPEGVNQEEP